MKAKYENTGLVSMNRGNSDHPLYNTYKDMIRRCYDKNRHNYKYYGLRGVKVSKAWRDDFWKFVEDMGERPLGYTLDRIDTNGDYSLVNCRWATRSVQASNKRGYSNTGIKGIRLNHGKYEAWRGRKYLGCFADINEAIRIQYES